MGNAGVRNTAETAASSVRPPSVLPPHLCGFARDFFSFPPGLVLPPSRSGGIKSPSEGNCLYHVIPSRVASGVVSPMATVTLTASLSPLASP